MMDHLYRACKISNRQCRSTNSECNFLPMTDAAHNALWGEVFTAPTPITHESVSVHVAPPFSYIFTFCSYGFFVHKWVVVRQ